MQISIYSIAAIELPAIRIGPLEIHGKLSPIDEHLDFLQCTVCGWAAVVRDTGGGFAPFEQWYLPEHAVLFAISGFWRMGLRPDGGSPVATHVAAMLASGIVRELRPPDCPHCRTAKVQVERIANRHREWSGDAGTVEIDAGKLAEWNRRLGNPCGAVSVRLFEANLLPESRLGAAAQPL